MPVTSPKAVTPNRMNKGSEFSEAKIILTSNSLYYWSSSMYLTGFLCLLKLNLVFLRKLNSFERIIVLKLSYETGSSGTSTNESLLIDFFVGVMYCSCCDLSCGE